MATPAQIHANQMNAQRSTGPKTPEGKAAVAQNRTTHGLTGNFRVLPCEDSAAFHELLDAYTAEYRLVTPTQRFLVTELAQAQWRIQRADAIEAELLSPGENPTYANVAAAFRDSDALTRLGRYAASARRAYYRAQEKLEAIGRESTKHAARQERDDAREWERRIAEYMAAPPPTEERPVRIPMPPALDRELDEFLERYPGLDITDPSLLPPRVRNWLNSMKRRAA